MHRCTLGVLHGVLSAVYLLWTGEAGWKKEGVHMKKGPFQSKGPNWHKPSPKHPGLLIETLTHLHGYTMCM